mmetsp:Transcript_16238/g.47425  ORF Transcript_16238/g.47425 Transcript_16238/m.47425 type:complete len:384 (+) Transcript_16238:113-1264(+)|eukprot:CAMPEP_0168363810 /NCGR_PEP_ID=MMETSP0228-20121227/3886_1 /TAXON_ID=133427 /ORGANISM="Protoceratium reticulatum, Strain CCCM 535 (=CCMP 1889)" /LENGTH=383 /DNA_ID=CAMNT_0008376555 /DNA_START=103 /DNA_END=1254 /DNA_ORIENTATION=-
MAEPLESTFEGSYGSLAVKKDEVREVEETPSTIKVHVALLVSYVIWGGGALVGKLGVHDTNPIVFEFWREGIMVTGLVIYFFCTCRPIFPAYEDTWHMIVSGFAYFVNQLFWFVGIKLGDPVVGSTWQTFLPVLTTLIAVGLGQEVLGPHKAAGILIAAGGATFMVIYDSRRINKTIADQAGSGVGFAHILFFLNILGNSAYFIINRGLSERYTPLMIVLWSNIVGCSSLFLIGVILHQEPAKPLVDLFCGLPNETDGAWNCAHSWLISRSMVMPLAYEAIGCSLISLTLLNWANKHTEASVVTVYVAVHAVTSTLGSAVLVSILGTDWGLRFGLRMPGLGTAGTILVITGLLIIFKYDQQQRSKDQTPLRWAPPEKPSPEKP